LSKYQLKNLKVIAKSKKGEKRIPKTETMKEDRETWGKE
jgi:hypothetical protein